MCVKGDATLTALSVYRPRMRCASMTNWYGHTTHTHTTMATTPHNSSVQHRDRMSREAQDGSSADSMCMCLCAWSVRLLQHELSEGGVQHILGNNPHCADCAVRPPKHHESPAYAHGLPVAS